MCRIILFSDNIRVALCISGFLWMWSVVCVAAASTPAAAKGTVRAEGAQALPSQTLHLLGLWLGGALGCCTGSCRDPGNPGTPSTVGVRGK